jgi:hypothetical protein
MSRSFKENQSRSELQSQCGKYLVADYLGLKSVSHTESLLGAANPQQQLLRWGYTLEEIERIYQKIRKP